MSTDSKDIDFSADLPRRRPEAPQILQKQFREFVDERYKTTYDPSNTLESIHGQFETLVVPEEFFVASHTNSESSNYRRYFLFGPSDANPFQIGQSLRVNPGTDMLWLNVAWKDDQDAYLNYEPHWTRGAELELHAAIPHGLTLKYKAGELTYLFFWPHVLRLEHGSFEESDVIQANPFHLEKEDDPKLLNSYFRDMQLNTLYAGGNIAKSSDHFRLNSRYEPKDQIVVLETEDINHEKMEIAIPRYNTVDWRQALQLDAVLADPLHAPTNADDFWRRADILEISGIQRKRM